MVFLTVMCFLLALVIGVAWFLVNVGWLLMVLQCDPQTDEIFAVTTLLFNGTWAATWLTLLISGFHFYGGL